MRMNRELECVLFRKGDLAEGPLWEEDRERLLWVDINGQSLHFFDPVTSEDQVHFVGQLIGAAVPVEKSAGMYLLALRQGLYWFGETDGSLEPAVSPQIYVPGTRLNDGKCDPSGRFWIGSMSTEGKRGSGSLYCVDRTLTVTTAVPGVDLANGMGWSPDGKVMYFIDTLQRTVFAYDFDMETGSISARKALIRFSDQDGLPDGMTVDTEGRLWIAHWGGGRVSCWDPQQGSELERIEVPARLVTSCTFGGKERSELYITTAVDHESGEEDRYGGSLFWIKTEAKGMQSAAFKGSMLTNGLQKG